HAIGSPSQPTDPIRDLVRRHAPKVVIFGHTKEPFNGTVDDRLWFNPGSSQGRNAKTGPTAGILEIDGTTIRAEVVPLDR
ncbi:MAG: hypothetical protein KDB53_09165, partial [Planctomycetes bacterium]|nr:hypothetical protein [Planctomycetota bacterium]